MHLEAWEGRISTNPELGQGCEVEVKIPTDPERDTVVAWKRGPDQGKVGMETRYIVTLTSGIWVLPGALQGLGLEDASASAASLVGRGTYRTAWAVPPHVRLPMLVFVRARPSLSGHTLDSRLFGCCLVCTLVC